jgi:hypothetical protein
LSQKSLVAYAYLLSKTGSDEVAEDLLRELTRRFGVNLELLLLGSRLGLKAGSEIEPVVSTLSKVELTLGYCKAAKGDRRTPKVSVIVTSYDQVDGIKSTVENVLASTYSNLEVIVVDDASSDGSRELLDTLVDARVKKVALSQNVGPYMARNAALKVAKGDFVAFHDCGDYSSINRIQAQIDLLLAEPSAPFLSNTSTALKMVAYSRHWFRQPTSRSM